MMLNQCVLFFWGNFNLILRSFFCSINVCLSQPLTTNKLIILITLSSVYYCQDSCHLIVYNFLRSFSS